MHEVLPVISKSIHTKGSLSLRAAPPSPVGEEGLLLEGEGSFPASSPASARVENELHEWGDAVVVTTVFPAAVA